MATVAYTLELVPTKRDFEHGMTLAVAPLAIVPSLFWEVHPLARNGFLGDWLIHEVDPRYAHMRGGLGFSMIAEAYLNFAWEGAPLFMAFGGFVLGAFTWWSRAREADELRLAAEGLLISVLLLYARGEFVLVARPILWNCVLPILFLKYVVPRVVRSARCTPTRSGGTLAQAHPRSR
jgi:hypothetical protein